MHCGDDANTITHDMATHMFPVYNIIIHKTTTQYKRHALLHTINRSTIYVHRIRTKTIHRHQFITAELIQLQLQYI